MLEMHAYAWQVIAEASRGRDHFTIQNARDQYLKHYPENIDIFEEMLTKFDETHTNPPWVQASTDNYIEE